MNRQTFARVAPTGSIRRRSPWWVIAVLALLLAVPAFPALAAPASQAAPAATSLLLGQYGFATLGMDESHAYVVEIPEDGTYFITAVDDAAAESFDLVVTDATGEVIFDDIFATVEVELPSGPLTLEFFAVEDASLAFVVVGQLGGMSASEAQPGKLVPGGVYVGEDISEEHYGRFTVPATVYPQQVLIYLEAGTEDTFWVSVDGDDTYRAMTTDDGQLLSFWTQGGDYTLYADPYNRRSSLTVIIFLSGPPPTLTVGESVSGALQVGANDIVYALPLDATYPELALNVESDEPLEIIVLDRYYSSNIYFSSYDEPFLDLTDVYPGRYFVILRNQDSARGEIPFTLSVEGEAGRPLGSLTTGQPQDNTFAEGDGALVFAFEVDQAGAAVTVSMSSPDADTDFDLSVGLRPGTYTWSQYTYGPDETVTFMAPIAGTYYATVVSNDYTGDFSLLVEEGDLMPALENNTLIIDEIGTLDQHVYRLETTRPNQILTVILVSARGEDLDIRVQGFDELGNNTVYLSTYRSGSVEVVSEILERPGMYMVEIDGRYASGTGAYFLEARVEDPDFFGRQWAIDATASSQFGDDGYSAMQATGEPDTLFPGDLPTAWAPLATEDGLQTLELTYAYAVVPAGVAIVESYNPGAVAMIEAYDAELDEWVVLWEGEAGAVEEDYRIFSPELSLPDFSTDRIRLTLDTDAVSGWNEIDAVQLFGRP